MTTIPCVICDAHGLETPALTEIIRDTGRDGLGTGKVYACDACIAAGTEEDREVMGITPEEWGAITTRLAAAE